MLGSSLKHTARPWLAGLRPALSDSGVLPMSADCPPSSQTLNPTFKPWVLHCFQRKHLAFGNLLWFTCRNTPFCR